MKRLLEIVTPENVAVQYELAGVGSRFAALIFDHFLQALLAVAVMAGMAAAGIDFTRIKSFNTVIVAAGIILIFLIVFGYFIFFELLLKGQTPGKKLVKLRVIKYNGQPVGFFDSFTRNILRIADMLPSLNLLGVIFMLASRNYRRVGDFAADTVVIRVKESLIPLTLEELVKSTDTAETEELNYYPLNNMEYLVLKEYLSRKNKLGERKKVFEFHLKNYFLEKFGINKQGVNDIEDFFKKVVRMNSKG